MSNGEYNRYDRYLDSQSNYSEDENRRRHIEHENEFLNSSAGSYYIKWNDKRETELYKRHLEIIENIKSLFLSKKIVYCIIISAILAFFTFNIYFLFYGTIGYMSLILFIMIGYYKLCPQTTVRSAITREQAIWASAREHAYRK